MLTDAAGIGVRREGPDWGSLAADRGALARQARPTVLSVEAVEVPLIVADLKLFAFNANSLDKESGCVPCRDRVSQGHIDREGRFCLRRRQKLSG